MDRTPSRRGSGSPKRLKISFVVNISWIMAAFAKQTERMSKLLKAKPASRNNEDGYVNCIGSPKLAPISKRPKQLFTSISNKAMTLVHRKKVGEESGTEEFGDGGVWQRAILMGDKCQPLDFSGVIYYDSNGKLLDEVPPRSPRASPLPSYLTRAND